MIFGVKSYDRFMKNKKRITLCGCKLSLQPTLRLIKDLPVFLKNSWDFMIFNNWINRNILRFLKGKNINKLWQKLFNQYKVKFKNYAYLWEKEAYKIEIKCHWKAFKSDLYSKQGSQNFSLFSLMGFSIKSVFQ